MKINSHSKPFINQATQRQTLEQRERRLLDALEQGAITVDEFRERRQKIRTQLSALERANNPELEVRRMEFEKFVAAAVRGAFALKRLACCWSAWAWRCRRCREM